MIQIGNYGTKTESNTTTKISSGGNSGQNNFNPVYLWGQYFDDSGDIDGSMTVKGDLEVSGKLTAGEMAIDELNVENLKADAANIKDLESSNFKADKAELENALVKELSATNGVMENLTVTKGAHFFELVIDKIKAAGGGIIFSPADGFKIDKVEEQPDQQQVTLYFRASDGDKKKKNMWEKNDQARCQNFNTVKVGVNINVSSKYFWALVKNTNNELNGGNPVKVDIGRDGNTQIEECHYIILSTVEGEYEGTLNPEVDDEVVMLGHRGNDVTRQSAIYISAGTASIDEDLKAPLFVQYAGINDFNLWSHKFNWFSAGLTGQGAVRGISASTISGDVKIGGSSIEDVINSKIIKTYRLLPNTNTVIVDKNGNLNPASINFSILVNDNGEIDNLYMVPDMMKAEIYGVLGNTNKLLTTIGAENPIAIGSSSVFGYEYMYCQLKATTNETIYDRCSVSIVQENDIDIIHGGHWEFAYYYSVNEPTQSIPDGTTTGNLPNGWTTVLRNVNFNSNEAIWMIQCFVSGDGKYGSWSTPVRITGNNGQPGEDGKDIEFVYTRTNNANPVPNAPAYNTTPDWPRTANNDHATSNGSVWYDNPQGVSEDNQYEWISMRTIKGDVFGNYTTPAIWSKWGEKGMDGDGYEYIYKAFAGEAVDNPNNATRGKISGEGAWISSTKQDTTDDYIPEGWYDEPVALTQENQKVWLSTRNRKGGENWSKFSEPTIWAHWAPRGSNGGSWVFAYQKSKTQPTKPTDNRAASSPWTTSMPSLSQSEIENGYSIWMTQCFVNGEGAYQTWSTPIPITGQAGKAGEDGKEIEFVYARTNSSTQISAPATTQTDDWHGTSNGNTWTDNPQGVTESLQYEWVSMRSKANGTWSAYSKPAIWSKWGEKGMDGDGYEYIYKRQSSSTAPSTPYMSNYATNSAYQTDGYLPTGDWKNNPQEVDSTYRYCFVSTRKKHDGIWQQFTTPVLWSQYSTKGSDGGRYAFIYKNSKDNPGKPSSSVTLDNLSGWSKEPTTPPAGQYTWMSQCFIGGDGKYGSWSTPIKITGEDGEAGKDGMSINFIYQRTNSSSKPSAPTYSSLPNSQYQTDDDYLGGTGTKWTKSPTGVDKDNQYEYVATRTKTDGKWGAYTVALWSKWGEQGMDGDGVEYIFKLSGTNSYGSHPKNITKSAYNDSTHGKNKNEDDFVPDGWTDNPQAISASNPYLFVSTRKGHKGAWSAFSDPKLWAQYANSTNGTNGTNGTDGQNAKIDYMVDNGCYAEIKYNTSTKKFTVDWKIDVFIVHVDGNTVTTVSSSTTPKLSDFTIKWKWNTSGETAISGTTASATGVSWSASDSRKFMLVTLYNSNGKKLDQLSIPVLLKSEATINVIQGQKAEITQTVTGNVKTELNFDGTIKDVKNSISRISQKCDSIESTVDDLDGEVSSIRQTSNNISLSVNNIKTGLGKCGIDIDSYKIKMKANTLEFEKLPSGSTAFLVTNSDGKEISRLSSVSRSHGRFYIAGATPTPGTTVYPSSITLEPQENNTLFDVQSANSSFHINAHGKEGTLRITLNASNAVYIYMGPKGLGNDHVPLILQYIPVVDGDSARLTGSYVSGQLVADDVGNGRYQLYIKKS